MEVFSAGRRVYILLHSNVHLISPPRIVTYMVFNINAKSTTVCYKFVPESALINLSILLLLPVLSGLLNSGSVQFLGPSFSPPKSSDPYTPSGLSSFWLDQAPSSLCSTLICHPPGSTTDFREFGGAWALHPGALQLIQLCLMVFNFTSSAVDS